MNTRDKGDLAVLAVATDLMKKGHKVAIPFGDSWNYDLIVMKPDVVRVQVKYVKSNSETLTVRTRVHTVLAGRVSKTKTYTAEMIDVIAVYDRTTDQCFYLPVSLVEGRESIILRLTSVTKCGRVKGVNWASDYASFI